MDDKAEIAVHKNDIEWMKSTLTDIKTEVKKTNGRVTKLELWKEKSLGIIVGITIVSSIAFGMLKTLFQL